MKNLVDIILDKERHLKFNLNALILAEKITGKKLSELGNNEQAFDLEFLRAMVFVGLLSEDKDLTIEQVGELIDMENIEYVANKLGEAMQSLKRSQV